MSYDLLLRKAKELWEQESAHQATVPDFGGRVALTCAAVSPAMLASLIDMVAEDPRQSANRLEPIIQRMLFESSFIDDGGDSVVFDAFDHINGQAEALANVLEEVRQFALRRGIWSTEPAAPMMFG